MCKTLVFAIYTCFARFQGGAEIVAPGSGRVIVTPFGPGGEATEGGNLAH